MRRSQRILSLMEAWDKRADVLDFAELLEALKGVELDENERARFMRHLAPRWDVHRHRVAPQIDDLLQAARQAGRLVVVAGRILGLADSDGAIEMSLRRRGVRAAETWVVRRVINCTGPARDVRAGCSDLVRSLIARGVGRAGALGLGLDVGDSGVLVGRDGREQERVFAIGPMLKERLWETTAVRELRTQTVELARHLLAISQERLIVGGNLALARSIGA